MNNSYQQVCVLASQLQAEGKTPSLALIRARAGKGVDAVALFSAYQQWLAQPSHPQPPSIDAAITTQTLTPTAEPAMADIQALQQDIRRLEHKVDQLSELIQQLIVTERR